MDHLGSGKAWDLSRKNEGLFILTPFSLKENPGLYRGKVEAIRSSLDFVRRVRQEYCIIAGASSIFNTDYDEMMRFHIESNSDITILYHNVGVGHEVDDQYHDVFFKISSEGRIERLEINPQLITLTARSLKSYIIRKDLLIYLVEDCFSKGEYKFSENLIRNNMDRLRIMAFEHKGYVGLLRSAKAYFDINMDLLKPHVRKELFQSENRIYTKAKDSVPARYTKTADLKKSMVANECVIEGMVENSILFRGVYIGKGAKIKNSIILPGSVVANDAQLEYVILDKNVSVRSRSQLVGNKYFPIVVGKGGMI
jgi:glucose-1-phosphate adenylyltransferase